MKLIIITKKIKEDNSTEETNRVYYNKIAEAYMDFKTLEVEPMTLYQLAMVDNRQDIMVVDSK